MLKPVLTLAALTLTAAAATAEPVDLTASEIETLLSGNTTVGDWSGTPYRQYYDPAGSTAYKPKGGAVDYGRWRTNSKTNKYESHWERSGWSAYGVMRDGDTLFWVESSGKKQPFVVEAGNTLNN